MSALEALINAGIGLIVSWTLTHFVLGYTATQSMAVTAMFFFASFLRAWIIRRAFKAWAS